MYPSSCCSDSSVKNLVLSLVLVSVFASLGLSGCGGSQEGGSTTKTPTGSKPVKPAEPPLVTEEEIARFVDAEPDPKVTFPEKEFTEARPYIFTQNKPAEGEKILKSKLDDAVKSNAGQTKLGQYCVRLGLALFNQKKEKEAVKYMLLAQRIFYKQPPEKRPMPNWFFNAHMYPGLYYNGVRKFPEAEVEWRKCVNVSIGAPAQVIQKEWRKVALMQLKISLVNQGKTDAAKQVEEQVKKF